MTLVLNYGGGRQTVAVCVLIARGVLPRPDLIVIANTGRERSTTWQYLWSTMRPFLRAHGLRIHIASRRLATVDLYSHQGTLLMPVYTVGGKFPAYCSSEWKARVVQRWLRARGITTADQWIGLAVDESKRIKHEIPEPGPWKRTYPLGDLLLTKADCQRIIVEVGLPLPHTSACWGCPNLDNSEWRAVRATPADWEKAIQLDEELRADDIAGGGSGVWLHEDRIPLRDVDLSRVDRKAPSRQCGLNLCQI